MRRRASSSAGRCASFRACSGNSPTWQSSWSAQLLLYRAATNADNGLPSAYETAIAKVACNQAGFEVASEAVQIMGAHGLFSRETLVEYCMRRTRGWMIAGGSMEILKNRIAERFRPPLRPAQTLVNGRVNLVYLIAADFHFVILRECCLRLKSYVTHEF